jgi:PAS domain S-box-containing protein
MTAAADRETSVADARYRLLVEAITDYAICMLDENGHVSSWNAGATRLKGYPEKEILGQHFSRFYTAEDVQAGLPVRALKTAADTGSFEGQGWRVRNDGTRFWAHVVINPIRDHSGNIVGYAKITRDLSERKAGEADLQRSDEQFRLLVQGVTDYAIYMLDPEGRVSSWNVGAERIKGYQPSEIIGDHFSRFYTQEDRAADLPRLALEEAATTGRFEKEGWRLRKDGSRFWASVIIDAIRSESGTLIGFAKITRDVTEKKESQQALERAQKELFQAQKMEAVGQLTGGVAHDFNNLLMAVLGSLEIARKRSQQGHDVTALIDNAIEGARRGASLTQRLLAFSRKQELKFETVDVLDLVRGMTDLLQRSIGSSIQIETHFPLNLPLVLSDPNQLENALLNLAVNARDAMPHGGAIDISAKRRTLNEGEVSELKAGNYVCLSMTDAGEGMDAETLEKATAPFFTTKGVGKGTGLGLSMIQGLMRQSGGKLRLTSAKGQGTTAELWLPVSNDALETGRPDAEPEKAVIERSLIILAVDDDPLVLMNTVLMLEDLGHTVFEAQSAVEALDVLQTEGEIDLVVTDHAMPKMTGTQLAIEMRSRGHSTPVVLATGYAELPDGETSDAIRLSKPFTQAQLHEVLVKALRLAPWL